MIPQVTSLTTLIKKNDGKEDLDIGIPCGENTITLSMKGISSIQSSFIRETIKFANKHHIGYKDVMCHLPDILTYLSQCGIAKKKDITKYLARFHRHSVKTIEDNRIISVTKKNIVSDKQVLDLSFNIFSQLIHGYALYQSIDEDSIRDMKIIFLEYISTILKSGKQELFFTHRSDIIDHIYSVTDYFSIDQFSPLLELEEAVEIQEKIQEISRSSYEALIAKLNDYYTPCFFRSIKGSNLSRDYIVMMSLILAPSIFKCKLNSMLKDLLNNFRDRGFYFSDELILNSYSTYSSFDYFVFKHLDFDSSTGRYFYYEPAYAFGSPENDFVGYLQMKCNKDKAILDLEALEIEFSSKTKIEISRARDLLIAEKFYNEPYFSQLASELKAFWSMIQSRKDGHIKLAIVKEEIIKQVKENASKFELGNIDFLSSSEVNYDLASEVLEVIKDMYASTEVYYSDFGPSDEFSTQFDSLLKKYINSQIEIFSFYLLRQKLEVYRARLEDILSSWIFEKSDDNPELESIESMLEEVKDLSFEWECDESISKFYPKLRSGRMSINLYNKNI
jgi:hypothetical protein